MAATQRELPDLNVLDSDALKTLLIEKHALVIEQDAALTAHRNEIENLKLLVFKLKQMKFGPSSEKLDQQIEQLGIAVGGLGDSASGRRRSIIDGASGIHPAE